MADRWRLLSHPPSGGAWNMSVDAALLAAAEAGATGPVLRFYGWDRPCLSLGYAQQVDYSMDMDFIERTGASIVRRPTGGRAILHYDEVTYSLTLPSSSAHYGSLKEVYGLVSAAIRRGLEDCGVALDPESGGVGVKRSPLCFAFKARHEITVGGRKVAGSAQRRLKSSTLQHGSISLSVDAGRVLSCFRWEDERARIAAAESFGGINDLTGLRLSGAEVRASIVKAFKNMYGIDFEDSALTPAEEERALSRMDEFMEKPVWQG